MQIRRRLVSLSGLLIAFRSKSPNKVCQCCLTAYLQLFCILFTQCIEVSSAKEKYRLLGWQFWKEPSGWLVRSLI